MNVTNGAHELQQENSRDAQGARKDRAPDGLPVIHATATPLRSATGRIHRLQTPRPGHEDPGESKLPGEW